MVNLTLVSWPALLGGFYLASHKSEENVEKLEKPDVGKTTEKTKIIEVEKMR